MSSNNYKKFSHKVTDITSRTRSKCSQNQEQRSQQMKTTRLSSIKSKLNQVHSKSYEKIINSMNQVINQGRILRKQIDWANTNEKKKKLKKNQGNRIGCKNVYTHQQPSFQQNYRNERNSLMGKINNRINNHISKKGKLYFDKFIQKFNKQSKSISNKYKLKVIKTIFKFLNGYSQNGEDNIRQNTHQFIKYLEQFSYQHLIKIQDNQEKQTQVERTKSTKNSNETIMQAQKSERLKKVLTVQIPKCPTCENSLTARCCAFGDHMIIICDSCGWCSHECKQNQQALNKLNFFDQLNILTIGSKLNNYQLKRLKKMSGNRQNNIKRVVKMSNYQFITKQKYLPGMPKQITCSFPILTGQACQQIYKNREQEHLLPLQIKQSSIKNAGLGVFSTNDINQIGTLVCSYLGQIGKGTLTPMKRIYQINKQKCIKENNSVFTIGWIDKQVIIMAPNLYSNVGRFINSNSQKKCNLKPNLCLLKKPNKENSYQFSIFLTTTKEIKAGDQLFYNYGKQYQNQ